MACATRSATRSAPDACVIHVLLGIRMPARTRRGHVTLGTCQYWYAWYEISIWTRRGHDTVLIDYYLGWAQSLYDPVMLPFTGYSVALRLALMSGDRRTDGRTDGQTDRRTEHRDPHGWAQNCLSSAPGRGRTALHPGPNTGHRREQ